MSDLVTVFRGGLPEALSVQAALEARGFRALIPGHHTKTIDPFITGGKVFDVEVQTPAEDAEAAARTLEEIRAEQRRDREEEAGNSGGEDAREAAPGVDGLDTFGSRMRWAGVFLVCVMYLPAVALVAFPVYVFFGFHYLRLASRAGKRPRWHLLTVASFVLVTVICGAIGFLWIRALLDAD